MAGDYGEKVGNFPLTEGESKSIQLEVEEVEELRAKGKKCLVGRMGVPKIINNEAFQNFSFVFGGWLGTCSAKRSKIIYGCSNLRTIMIVEGCLRGVHGPTIEPSLLLNNSKAKNLHLR